MSANPCSRKAPVGNRASDYAFAAPALTFKMAKPGGSELGLGEEGSCLPDTAADVREKHSRLSAASIP
jgi:hypothetical protein